MRFFFVIVMVSSLWTCSKDRGSTGKTGAPPAEGVMKPGAMIATGPSVPMGGGGTSVKPKAKVKGIPSPATLTVLNDTKKPLSFDTTFGTDQPFGVVSLDGSVAPSVVFGP
ncbi:hypothetical protein KKF84_02210, partial [Myxococcota bacterium]|nr:hypothetical protein [Myxococcota bacterium]